MPIVKLHAHCAGGIPGELTLDFAKGSTASSIVLYGDNGTGKSSIVDAIEFAVQARVQRADRPGAVLEALKSFAVDGSPIVEATLDTGEVVRREFEKEDEGGVVVAPAEAHHAYSLAPVVIRRKDVTRFWETPEEERQVLFRSYFQDPDDGNWVRLSEGEQAQLRKQRNRLKNQRREHLATLLVPLDVLPDQVPLGSQAAFDEFVAESFSDSFGRNWPTSGPNLSDEGDVDRFQAALEVRRLIAEILVVQRRLLDARAADVGQTALAEVLANATSELGAAFANVSDVAFVSGVEIKSGGPGDIALRIRVRTNNGRVARPEEILSEANLDLLALLIFTSIAKAGAEQGQDRLLVLDDVVQSVDTTIRVKFLKYLATHFADWQLIFTTHDRMWRELTYDTLNSHGIGVIGMDITAWSYLSGPQIRGFLGGKTDRLRSRILAGDDATDICSAAGGALEELCHQLSWRLPIQVTRDKRDHYMLGALWPPIAERLSQLGLGSVADAVSTPLKLRNLVGAHYVEWAQSLSDAEGRAFGEAVVALNDTVRCPDCRRGWIKPRGSRYFYSCGCGVA